MRCEKYFSKVYYFKPFPIPRPAEKIQTAFIPLKAPKTTL